MLVRALLQTSLVLWLAEQTLQGGVKPQSVSWGRVLPARAAGALGALGNRYANTKAMKTGLGRYAGAQLGAGGYRALGYGGRAGLRGGYGAMGGYGAGLGAGMGLGTGLNGIGMGLGQAGKRVYGAGLGVVPGYGALGGMGYPGARPGVGLRWYPIGHGTKGLKAGAPPADLAGPEMAHLGQADLKREKSGAFGPSNGKRDLSLGQEVPSMSRGGLLGPTAPESHAGTGFRPVGLPHEGELKGMDQLAKSPLDKQRKLLAALQRQRGQTHEPIVPGRRDAGSHGAALSTGGIRPLPLYRDDTRMLGPSPQVQGARDYDSPVQQNQRTKNCENARHSPGEVDIHRHELLGSEAQRTPSFGPQPHFGKEGKYIGRAPPQAQGEGTYQLPVPHPHDYHNKFPLQQGQPNRNYVAAGADGQVVRDLGAVATDNSGPRPGGTAAVENLGSRGSPNLQVQGAGSYRPVTPGEHGSQSLASVERHAAEGLGVPAGVLEGKSLPHIERDFKQSKPLGIPGKTAGKNPATSYLGGAGNYLGAGLGAGAYGAGLGQGAYLGAAAGKLGAAAALGQGAYPAGVGAGGYGEGAYLGAVAGNGFGADAGKGLAAGYGNGYGDALGAGLGYPAELADGAVNKAGKSRALGAGAYAGQLQGALGAGLDSTGGKFAGGAAQVPYGNAPVIPAGLEGEGGYPLSPQQLALGAEGAKANKYGYGAQLGATKDALERAAKYGGVNGALGAGYKG